MPGHSLALLRLSDTSVTPFAAAFIGIGQLHFLNLRHALVVARLRCFAVGTQPRAVSKSLVLTHAHFIQWRALIARGVLRGKITFGEWVEINPRRRCVCRFHKIRFSHVAPISFRSLPQRSEEHTSELQSQSNLVC